MQADKVIELARQAGLDDEVLVPWSFEIQAFAKLVAAKESERIVILLKSLGTNTNEDGGEDEPTRDDCIFAIKGEA